MYIHKGKYVFAQLLYFIDKDIFFRLEKTMGIVMSSSYQLEAICGSVFAQIANRESLRDVVLATQVPKAWHLGSGKHAAYSIIADANTKCDFHFFVEFSNNLISEIQLLKIK